MNQECKLIKIVLFGLLILTAIFSLGTLSWKSYPLELLSNFRVYYLLLSGAIAIACFIYPTKGFWTKLILYCSLGLIAFNSVWIVPWYLPNSQQGSGNSIRVLTFNINIQNNDWDEIAKSIRTIKPNIATVLESSIKAKEQLSQRLNDLLPFVYRTSGGGITIFSQFPLVSPQSKTFNNGTILVTSLQVEQTRLKLIAAHPIAPVNPKFFNRRNGLLKEVTTYLLQQQKTLTIFLGDMNLTPWSPYYAQLILNTGLHNTRLGFGIEPSWIEPATYIHYPDWITTLVKSPIDHIFVSKSIKVSDCQTKKAANSDHRMLWSDLVF